jgi:hypothetical protein
VTTLHQEPETALFPEQVPDGPYPKELLVDSCTIEGLRYVTVGEDGENYVFLGHPDLEYVMAAVRAITVSSDNDPDKVSSNDVEYLYARLLDHCPDHQKPVEDCTWCTFATSEEWWLDWSGGNATAGHPNYFPITLWRSTW